MYKIMFNFFSILFSKHFSSFKGYNVSWLPLIILNNFKDIEVPDEHFTLFYFSLGVWITIVAILVNFYNIILTITILYYKNKYNLELRFQNYPWIVKIIKLYQKVSYLTITLEVIWILIFALIIFAYSSFMILRIANII